MKRLSALFIFCVLATASPVYAQGEPVIAPEVGRLMAEEGVDAANARFNEMAKSDSLNMTDEIQGMHTLMSAYMQAGNHEAAEAVANMAAQLTMSMMSGGMGMDLEAMEQAEMAAREQEKRNREEEQKLAQKQQARSRGKSRADLERFIGLYGEIDSNNMGKTIFVTISCDGYLVTGPMWADVGPWWMRSAAEYVFTYADSWTNISMEFKLDKQGRAHLMEHDIEGIGAPIEWKRELPDDFSGCVERPRR